MPACSSPFQICAGCRPAPAPSPSSAPSEAAAKRPPAQAVEPNPTVLAKIRDDVRARVSDALREPRWRPSQTETPKDVAKKRPSQSETPKAVAKKWVPARAASTRDDRAEPRMDDAPSRQLEGAFAVHDTMVRLVKGFDKERGLQREGTVTWVNRSFASFLPKYHSFVFVRGRGQSGRVYGYGADPRRVDFVLSSASLSSLKKKGLPKAIADRLSSHSLSGRAFPTAEAFIAALKAKLGKYSVGGKRQWYAWQPRMVPALVPKEAGLEIRPSALAALREMSGAAFLVLPDEVLDTLGPLTDRPFPSANAFIYELGQRLVSAGYAEIRAWTQCEQLIRDRLTPSDEGGFLLRRGELDRVIKNRVVARVLAPTLDAAESLVGRRFPTRQAWVAELQAKVGKGLPLDAATKKRWLGEQGILAAHLQQGNACFEVSAQAVADLRKADDPLPDMILRALESLVGRRFRAAEDLFFTVKETLGEWRVSIIPSSASIGDSYAAGFPRGFTLTADDVAWFRAQGTLPPPMLKAIEKVVDRRFTTGQQFVDALVKELGSWGETLIPDYYEHRELILDENSGHGFELWPRPGGFSQKTDEEAATAGGGDVAVREYPELRHEHVRDVWKRNLVAARYLDEKMLRGDAVTDEDVAIIGQRCRESMGGGHLYERDLAGLRHDFTTRIHLVPGMVLSNREGWGNCASGPAAMMRAAQSQQQRVREQTGQPSAPARPLKGASLCAVGMDHDIRFWDPTHDED